MNWIEVFLKIQPDGGRGTTELLYLCACSLGLTLFARAAWRASANRKRRS